jgi:predicted RNase H-like nuclease (RuvC/YqgF family)
MMDKQPQQFQPQSPPNINQTFQLAPNQPNNNVKYATSREEVKKELVFGDTIFVNKEYDRMWLKNARGETKEYELIEIVEVDVSTRKIEELTADNEILKKEIESLKNTISSMNDKKQNSGKSSKP